MTSHRRGGPLAADADGPAVPAANSPPRRPVTAMMLLAAAALDLTRCGLVLAARQAEPNSSIVAVTVSAGLAAAAVSLWTALGCKRGLRWSGWAALLIGAGSAPQAAASGFHAAYTIPDTATAALGVLVAVGVLATAGRNRRPETCTGDPCTTAGRATR